MTIAEHMRSYSVPGTWKLMFHCMCECSVSCAKLLLKHQFHRLAQSLQTACKAKSCLSVNCRSHLSVWSPAVSCFYFIVIYMLIPLTLQNKSYFGLSEASGASSQATEKTLHTSYRYKVSFSKGKLSRPLRYKRYTVCLFVCFSVKLQELKVEITLSHLKNWSFMNHIIVF